MKKSGQKVQTQVYIFATFMRFLFAYTRKNDYLCTQNSKIGMKIKLLLGVLVISTMTVLQSSVSGYPQRSHSSSPYHRGRDDDACHQAYPLGGLLQGYSCFPDHYPDAIGLQY